MAGGWRVTARMVATAVAASAVSRAAESVRKLLAEAAPLRELERPAEPSFLEPPAHLTAATSMHAAPAAEDRVIAAQVGPPHEFGPTPLIAPSHGIGFRSEPRRREPAAEMPVISRPSGEEPEGRDAVAPAEPVIMPKSVRTAAAIVQDLEEDPADDDGRETETGADDRVEQPRWGQPDTEPSEPVVEDSAVEPEPVTEPEVAPEEPVTESEPVRALRLTAPPIEDTPVVSEPGDLEDELVEPAEPAPAPQPAVIVEPTTAQVEDKNSDEKRQPKDKTKGAAKGKHRRHTSAISGAVQSSRGRGLRGMRVTVLDGDQKAIATAVTGAGGAFVVEELPAGSYRLTVSDEADGDFATGWHGGSSFTKADTIKVKQGKTRRKIGVTLVSAAKIDFNVDLRKKKAVVEVKVTDRATGTPAEGSVKVSTKLFSAELPLTEGRTALTLVGTVDGYPRLSKKVKVDYSGSTHTRPESATAKLR